MKKSNESSSRFIAVDVMRAMAILMVVYLHTILDFTLRPDFFATKAWFVFELFVALSRTSIPLFFILSGYLALGKSRTIHENWQRLKRRILIPLVFSSLVIMILDYQKYMIAPKHLLPFWQSQMVMQTDFPSSWLWFLAVLFTLHLLNPLWQPIFTNKDLRKTALYLTFLAFLFTVISTVIKYPGLKVETFFSSLTGWLGYSCFYLYGGLIRNKYLSVNRKILNSALIGAGLLLQIVGDYYTQFSTVRGIKFLFAGYTHEYLSISVICVSIGLFNLLINSQFMFLTSSKSGKVTRTIVTWLSSLSYGIYLVHLHVIYFFFSVLKFEFDKSHMNIYIFSIIYYLLILSISIALTYGVRKLPYLRMIIGER
jgi:surface polysaccharide O-acyltransferase-like enzyme